MSYDFSISKIRSNLNSNTTDYVNMFTSLFLISALVILIAFVKDYPNRNIYIPIIGAAIFIFFFHAAYKLALIIKRKIKLNKLIDNDELVTARVDRISLECHRGRYDTHALLSFIRIKVEGTRYYGVLPKALPIKRITFYKKLNELIKNNQIEVSYYKSPKIIDFSYGELFNELAKLSELK